MMQLFRNLILLVALGAGTIGALLQICSRPAAPAEDANRSKTSARTRRWLIPILAFLLLLAFGGFLLIVAQASERLSSARVRWDARSTPYVRATATVPSVAGASTIRVPADDADTA